MHDTNYKYRVDAIFTNMRHNMPSCHPKYMNMKQIYMDPSQISDSFYFYFLFLNEISPNLNPPVSLCDLESQLTETESKVFLMEVISTNYQIMREALLNYLNQNQDSKDIGNATKQCKDIALDTLQSRAIILKHNTKKTKLDTLPQEVIGTIASFLSQRTYSKFSRCNRSIYLDCNAPSTLREIISPWLEAQDRWLSASDLPDLSLFPYVHELHLSVHELPNDKGPAVIESISRMQRLRAISFYDDGHSSSLETMERVAANKDIAERMDRLGVLLGDEYEPDFRNLISMIISFKNIKYLDLSVNSRNLYRRLSRVHSRPEDVVALLDQFKSTFSNLKGLTLGNVRLNRLGLCLLMASGQQLQFLALFNIGDGRCDTLSYGLESIDFGNLKELQLDHESFRASEIILKSARNLLKIRIDFINPSECFYDSAFRQIADWFTLCPLMHHLQIHVVNSLVLDYIDKGLRSRAQLRDTECSSSMKIAINGWTEQEIIIFKPKVTNILEAMMMCDLDDFMLILKLKVPFTGNVSFQDNVPSEVRVLNDGENGNGDLIVFSNTDCKINGYAEHWLMDPNKSFLD